MHMSLGGEELLTNQVGLRRPGYLVDRKRSSHVPIDIPLESHCHLDVEYSLCGRVVVHDNCDHADFGKKPA